MMNRQWKWWRRVASVLGLAAVLTAGAGTDEAAAQRRGHGAPTMAATRTARAEAPAGEAAAGVVNLNTATEADLVRLPGIGPSKAQAILAFRQRAGRFRRVEDVLRVRGIGRATFRRLQPMLRVDGPTTLGAPG